MGTPRISPVIETTTWLDPPREDRLQKHDGPSHCRVPFTPHCDLGAPLHVCVRCRARPGTQNL